MTAAASLPAAHHKNTLPVVRVGQIPEQQPGPQWLIEDLWGTEAVGLIGGMPKSAKTWVGLDLALSVASGTPCLGHYRVMQPGPVLVYLAEDPIEMLRRRVQAMATHRHLTLDRLQLHVILAQRLRLDDPEDYARLFETARMLQPRLLLLDPLVRLHRMNENDAVEMAQLLSGLRELQQRLGVAVVVVHHTRKNGGGTGPAGLRLRGSSDLWAWSDSNLYLRRSQGQLLLAMEHRAAAAPDPVMLRLVDEDEDSIHLQLSGQHQHSQPPLADRIVQLLCQTQAVNRAQLRAQLQVRNELLGRALRRLEEEGRIVRGPEGWRLICSQPN